MLRFCLYGSGGEQDSEMTSLLPLPDPDMMAQLVHYPVLGLSLCDLGRYVGSNSSSD